MNEKTTAINEIPMDARRYLLDVQAVYGEYRKVRAELLGYRGGMTWKRSGGKEYLFRIRNRKGNGRSLGPRDARTEALFRRFHECKALLVERERGMRNTWVARPAWCARWVLGACRAPRPPC